jgi:hypothetical protein
MEPVTNQDLEVTPKNLVRKLAEIVAEIDHVEKKGRNEFQKYSYVKAADLANAVRQKLSARKVFLLSDVIGRESVQVQAKDGGTWMFDNIDVLYTFLDGETGEKLCFKMPGTGADKGDKAVYKAITGSLKYALRNAFLVPDEAADPEADESTDKEAGKLAAAAVAASKTAQSRATAAPQAPGRAQIPDPHSRIVFAVADVLAGSGPVHRVSGFLATIRPAMVERCFAWPAENPLHKGAYIVTEEFWAEFQTLCAENQIHIQMADSVSPETAGAADSPKRQPSPAAPLIEKYETVEGQKFVSVVWNGLKCSCWDTELWPWLKQYKGKPAELTTVTKTKADKTYHNIVGIVSLDGKPFDNDAKRLEIQRGEQ